jgi:transposase
MEKLRLVYLSPYSPEFNPIEHLWSKLKGFLRAVEARTVETLHQAVALGLAEIGLEDVRNWFAHCCYCD